MSIHVIQEDAWFWQIEQTFLSGESGTRPNGTTTIESGTSPIRIDLDCFDVCGKSGRLPFPQWSGESDEKQNLGKHSPPRQKTEDKTIQLLDKRHLVGLPANLPASPAQPNPMRPGPAQHRPAWPIPELVAKSYMITLTKKPSDHNPRIWPRIRNPGLACVSNVLDQGLCIVWRFFIRRRMWEWTSLSSTCPEKKLRPGMNFQCILPLSNPKRRQKTSLWATTSWRGQTKSVICCIHNYRWPVW